MTVLPDRYREVSVTDVDVPLELEPLRALLMSRPVYRRTRYVVVRAGGRAALVEVDKRESDGLFWDVTAVRLLAGPDETAWVVRPELDPGIPSDLAGAAADCPEARCVVLEGRYGHISFVLDSTPVRLHVLDVAPPHPAKLLDQVQRVLATAEDLPGVLPVPQVVELGDLVPTGATGDYLLPCRGGGMQVPGTTVHYLDEVPPQRDWTLLGCARSQAIHQALYGGSVPQVDTCPRVLARAVELAPGEVLLTKCCLLEEHVEVDGQTVVVPWGASFGHLREALELSVERSG
ncbi:MAG TPA: hypothetical protein VFR07_17110 [Mycobacteriales bacterium]|nr:hypothetical protein [Mycobacteriales bacterium]